MLKVKDLQLAYAQNIVLEVDELSLEKGEIGCILGPSGCGKSSFLRAISGLLEPKKGHIEIDQQSILTANKKVLSCKQNVGMVFQDLCLFPHMTVSENVAYGLTKCGSDEKNARVTELLSLVGLEGFAKRYPFELSGGQQQRVAIARAIAPQPSLLLMDEPFSSLDPSLREQLASELRKLLKRLNMTALIVTHDQQEAFALADKIAVFDKQVCQQWGTAYELYHRPASLEVASFVGEGSLLAGNVEQDGESVFITTPLGKLTADKHKPIKSGQTVLVLVRPDDILHDDKSERKARITDRQFRGSHIMFKLDFKDSILSCLAPSHHNHQVGESFGFKLDIQHLVYFPHS